jgi:hypothetical protein
MATNPRAPSPENERGLIEWLIRYGRDFELVRKIYRSNLDPVTSILADAAQKELRDHNSYGSLLARSKKIRDLFLELYPSINNNILNILYLDPTNQAYYVEVYMKMTVLDYFLLYKYKDKFQAAMNRDEGLGLEKLYDVNVSTAPIEEHETIPFGPNLPEVTKSQPIKAYSAGSYMILLVRDVDPIGGVGLKYSFVLALVSTKTNRPTCFVTLENSPVAKNVLCVFQPDGTHLNLGPLREPDLLQAFISKGLAFLGEKFHFAEIVELTDKPKAKSWWRR